METKHVNPAFITLGRLVIALIAFFTIYVSTNKGIGISVDSVAYLKYSDAILDWSKSEFITGHWPPLYPIVLALASLPFDSSLEGARWFHSLLYAANVLLIPIFLLRGDKPLALYQLGFSIILLTSPSFFSIHMMAWSEPLFILTVTAGFHFLIQKNPTKFQLILSALLIGLSYSVRYAGLFFVFGVAFCLILNHKRDFTEKFRLAALYFSLALIPAFLVTFLHIQIVDSATNRHLLFHPPSWGKVFQGITVLRDWYMPLNLKWASVAALLLWAFAAFDQFFTAIHTHKIEVPVEKKIRSLNKYAALTCLVLSVGYTSFILVSITFVDAYIPLDNRILAPTYIFLIGSFINTTIYSKPILRAGLVFILITMIMTNAFQHRQVIEKAIKNVIGFMTHIEISKPFIEKLSSLSNDNKNLKIYSNGTNFLYLANKTVAVPFVKKYEPATKLSNPQFKENYKKMLDETKSGNAVIVYLNGFDWRNYYPSLSNIEDELDSDIYVFYSNHVGKIFMKKSTIK